MTQVAWHAVIRKILLAEQRYSPLEPPEELVDVYLEFGRPRRE